MPALTITDLENGKLDLDHIAAIATSLAPTATDRLGHTKRTVRGAVLALDASVSDVQTRQGLAAQAIAEAVANLTTEELEGLAGSAGASMVGSGARSVQARLDDHISLRDKGAVLNGVADDAAALSQANADAFGRPILITGIARIASPITITAPLVDVVRQIFTLDSQVTIDNGLPVRPEWWGDVQGAFRAAVNALPAGGGTVRLRNRRYKPSAWSLTDCLAKPNVVIEGARLPRVSASGDRLEGGSVIEGRTNVFADGFASTDVGYDCGAYVVDQYYGGASTTAADHPQGGTWDAFAFANPGGGAALRKGVRIGTLIGLCKSSSTLGHAALLEAIDGLDFLAVAGVYGTHGAVIKSKRVRGSALLGCSAGSNNVIFKSDALGTCEDVVIDGVAALRYAPGVTPSVAPSVAEHGVLINPQGANIDGLQIGRIVTKGSTRGVEMSAASAAVLANVQIDSILADGYDPAGTVMDYAFIAPNSVLSCARIQIGKIIGNNVRQGLYWSNGLSPSETQLTVDQMSGTNITNGAVYVLGNAHARIGVLQLQGAGGAYYIDDGARLLVGEERLQGVTTKWMRNPPALGSGWSNQGSSNTQFEVFFKGYDVCIRGLIQAASGAGAKMAVLPPYLRPARSARQPGYVNAGSIGFALLGVDAGGDVVLNDGAAPAAGAYVSLNGLRWQLGA
jgi:hypothetical protein